MDSKIEKIVIHNDEKICGFFKDYRFLSNFEEAQVVYEGVKYPSSENAYQAAKTFNLDYKKRLKECSPSESKKISRSLEVRDDWEEVKLQVMEDVVRDKFTRNIRLKLELFKTGDKYLEETNYWSDRFFGVCDGVGHNHLGKILMKIREELKS